MIARIFFGLLRLKSNTFITLTILLLMFPLSLTSPLRMFSVIMVVILITPAPACSFSLGVPPFVCLADTLRPKMVKPSALFAPPRILFALSFYGRDINTPSKTIVAHLDSLFIA